MDALIEQLLERHPNPLYERGRRCVTDHCITILSVFNPGPRCYCCEDEHAQWLRERGRLRLVPDPEPESWGGEWAHSA